MNVVGYLIAFPGFTGVCCQECLDNSDVADANDPSPVALHRENVGPYKQTCHGCGKTLVEPRTPIWPELFEIKRDLEWKAKDLSVNPLFVDAVNAK